MDDHLGKPLPLDEKQSKPPILETHFQDWDKIDKREVSEFASKIEKIFNDYWILVAKKGLGAEMLLAEVKGFQKFQEGWQESKLMKSIKKNIEELGRGALEVRFSSTEVETKKPDVQWIMRFEAVDKADGQPPVLNVYIKSIEPRGPKTTIETVVAHTKGLGRLFSLNGTIED